MNRTEQFARPAQHPGFIQTCIAYKKAPSALQQRTGLSHRLFPMQAGTNSNRLMHKRLFREIQNKIAVIKHQYQRCEKKQKHQDIQDAVTFAAGVGDILHISFEIDVVQKSGAKIKSAGEERTRKPFFWRNPCLSGTVIKICASLVVKTGPFFSKKEAWQK
mgnify:CR=1 FL=1